MGYRVPKRPTPPSWISSTESSYEGGYVENNYADKLGDLFNKTHENKSYTEVRFRVKHRKSELDAQKQSLKDEVELLKKQAKIQRESEYKKYEEDFMKEIKKTETKKGNTMNQFLTLDIGSNKATVDLSKVRKQGLVFEKTMFGKKPKIVIYYNDRPETPEVNFELNSEEEARSVYKSINQKLDRWAEESNSAKLQVLQKELDVMHQQKDALLEEKEVLMDVFNQFKEMMQIMEDDTKTSSLVQTIKEM